MLKRMAILVCLAAGMIVNGWNISTDDRGIYNNTGWVMLHGNVERTSFSKGAAPDSPYVVWSADLNEATGSAPIISNGSIIILGSSSLSVLKLQTGEVLESYDFQGWSTPTAFNNILLTPCFWKLICFDTIKETILWESPLEGGSRSNPLVYCGKIFMGGGGCPWIENADKKEERKVVCLDQFTGSVNWEFSTEGKVCSSPSLSEGVLYIGSNDTCVYALSMNNGDLVWKVQIGAGIYDSPVVFEDFILVAADSLYCLDKNTGHFLWKFHGNSKMSPAAAYELVFFTSDNSVYALDVEGTVIWESSLDSEVVSLLVADSKVFLWTATGVLYALNAFTGCELWHYETGIYNEEPPSFQTGILALSEGMLVLLTDKGKLFAFGIDPEFYLEKAIKYEEENHHYLAYQFYVKAWACSEDLCEKEAIEEKLKSIKEEKLLKSTDQDLVEFNHVLAQGYSLLYEGDVKKALRFLEEAEKQAFHLKSERIGEIECLMSDVRQMKKENTASAIFAIGSISAFLLFLTIAKVKM